MLRGYLIVAAMAIMSGGAACSTAFTPTDDCASPRELCGGSCVSILKDVDNCGACNRACKSGEVCTQGTCSTICSTNTSKCEVGGAFACINTARDNAHCGACGNACGQGTACAAGKCEIVCSVGYSVCGGATAQTDDAGAPDATPATPDASTPDATRDAATDAGPTPQYCAKLTEDPLNCGKCGTACDLNKRCLSGLCCNPSETACGGACVDTKSDNRNCGTCNSPCTGNQPFCVDSACTSRRVFSGIVKDEAVATITNGWTECFKENYNGGAALPAVLAACNKANIMVACRQTGAATLTLAAQGPRTEVFADVGAGAAAKRVANGVSWYFNGSSSMGFAPGAEPINRNTCDYTVPGETASDQRMCIHTGNNMTANGFRCGTSLFVNGAVWERIIYHAD
jgi:hypothetical protein